MILRLAGGYPAVASLVAPAGLMIAIGQPDPVLLALVLFWACKPDCWIRS
jgi:hypothetical protein